MEIPVSLLCPKKVEYTKPPVGLNFVTNALWAPGQLLNPFEPRAPQTVW